MFFHKPLRSNPFFGSPEEECECGKSVTGEAGIAKCCACIVCFTWQT